MNYTPIFDKVSEELGLPREVVVLAYKSYWKFIRLRIQGLPLKEDISEEEFSLLKTNFNIPSIGKLSCTYNRMVGVNKRFEYIKNIKKYVGSKKD